MSGLYSNLQIGVPQTEQSASGVQDASPSRIYADGTMEHLPGAQHNAAHDIGIGTVLSPGGIPVIGRAPRNDDFVRVSVGGYVTDVRYATARDSGWLPKESAAPSQEQAPQAPATEQEPAPAEDVDLAAEAKAAFTAALPNAGDWLLERYLATGTLDPTIVEGSGLTFDEVKQRFGAIVTPMMQHQTDALAEVGIDGNDFREWCEKHAPKEIRAAAREHYVTGKVGVYSALAQRYVAARGRV